MSDSGNDIRRTMPDYSPRYEVHREIGYGATAHVYLAHDTRHDRSVALKVLRPELTHAVGVERFLREIKLAAGLQHPNILAVFDSGEADDSVYYVMPYIDGVTLRERLQQGAIPLAEAIRILGDVGDALAYAHDRGIIHRDVKPENIFLSGGHAYVGDFGIALAFMAAQQEKSSARLTGHGLVVGTPTYMSPEQAIGDEEIDGRSDQFSLACVFFEMLAGRPPFGGTGLAERFITPPPQLRSVRPDLSAGLEGAIGRALALDPGRRFPTVKEFVDAIAAENAPRAAPSLWARTTWPVRIGIAAAALAGAFGIRQAVSPKAPVLDRSTIAVFPFIHGDSLPELHSDDCRMYLSRAIDGRWSDVTVVDEMRLASATARFVGAKPTIESFIQAARNLNAGYIASGTVRVLNNSVQFQAQLVDVATGATVNRKDFVVPRDSLDATLDRAFAVVAESLLVHVAGVAVPIGEKETKSLHATQAFIEGHRALWRWEIDSAVSAFQRAVDADTGFASANYWLAQSREWTQGPSAPMDWSVNAGRAARSADRLPRSERAMAFALAALSTKQYQLACDSLRSITRREPANFAALFALSDCLNRDQLVVPDSRSPTGWRFRSSRGEASRVLSAALTSAPIPARAFRTRAFARLRDYSPSDMQLGRTGVALVGRDSLKLYAFPALERDTIVYWPAPYEDWRRGLNGARSPTHAAAVRRNREVVRNITREWVSAYPTDALALAAHAGSLESLGDLVGTRGDTGALDLLARARRANPTPALDIEFAYSIARVLMKAGRYADAARVGDSLLNAVPTPVGLNIDRLAGIAAMLGKVDLAATLSARTADSFSVYIGSRPLTPPILVSRAAMRASVFAAAEDADSAYAAIARLDHELRSSTLPGSYAALRQALVADPETYLFATNPPSRRVVADTTSPLWLVKLQRMFLANDRAGIARKVDSTLDATAAKGFLALDIRLPYHGARLLLAMGDTARAIRLLDASIAAIPTSSTSVLRTVSDALSIPLTLALRAEVAAARGDRAAAQRFGSSALALLSKSDAHLARRVDALRRIASSSP